MLEAIYGLRGQSRAEIDEMGAIAGLQIVRVLPSIGGQRLHDCQPRELESGGRAFERV